jgi:hypothetical protein
MKRKKNQSEERAKFFKLYDAGEYDLALIYAASSIRRSEFRMILHKIVYKFSKDISQTDLFGKPYATYMIMFENENKLVSHFMKEFDNLRKGNDYVETDN